MALVLADRVRETTTTAGTGTITLLGAVPSCQSFAVVGDGNTTYYTIVAYTGTEYEVGIGTYTSSGTTLSRDTVLASSNGGSLVNFSAGTKDVFVDYPAGKAVYEDAAGNVDGYPITGGTINNTTIGATTPSTGVFTTLTATGQTSLGGDSSNPSLRANVSSGVTRWIEVSGSVAGDPLIQSWSTGSSTGMDFSTRGTGNFEFRTASNSNLQAVIAHTASAVNYVQVTGAATGSFPTVSAQGSDANLSFFINAKGNGAVNVSAHRTNYLQLAGAGATLAPSILSQGSDTNIDLNLTPKGTGTVVANGPFTATGQTSLGGVAGAEGLRVTPLASSTTYINARAGINGGNAQIGLVGTGNTDFVFYTLGTGAYRFLTGGIGPDQFRVSHTASAVNYVQVTGAATTAFPIISSQGSDSAVSLGLTAKGGNAIIFFTNSGSNRGLRVSHTASSVNYVDVSGGATGSVPVIGNAGSDSNIGLALKTTGTGAIDLAAGSRGVNISNGGTVTAITTTANGTAYTSLPSVAISAPTTAGGVQATASISAMFTSTATVNSGGTGYTIGDVLTLVGGTVSGGGGVGRYTVASVSSGVITAVTRTQGNYLVLPTNPVSVTGGTGTDATLNLTWLFQSASITNAGSGYVEQPTVTFSGGGGSGAAAYATVGGVAELKFIGTGTDSVTNQAAKITTSAGTAMTFRQIGGSDTFWQVGAASSTVGLIAKGNANGNALVGANGTGSVRFTTNGDSINEQMRVANTNSAVNYVQVTGAATGGGAAISAQGSDTNISLRLQSKGTGGIQFAENRTNYISAFGSGTGGSPSFLVQGSDTNIDLNLTPKGTGTVVANGPFTATGQTSLGGVAGSESLRVLQPVAAAGLRLQAGVPSSTVVRLGPAGSAVADFRILAPTFTNFYTGSSSDGLNDGAAQMRVSHTASAVNYLQVTGAATGAGPTITAGGSDASVPLVLAPKGGTTTQFWTSGGRQFQVGHTASTVNYATVTGGATGSGPIFSVNGTDTNIDLALTPKGTGNVRFGTYTGTALSISGFIEIKDSGGTVRKLAVVA